jgi:hypothetical protein
MADFDLAGVLLFLIPGLCAYSALYRLFAMERMLPSRLRTSPAFNGPTVDGSRREPVYPSPPPGNSIKALTMILLWSVAAHAVSALITFLILRTNAAICDYLRCFAAPANATFDLYQLATEIDTLKSTAAAKHLSSGHVSALLAAALLQGFVSYSIVRRWLIGRFSDKNLPRWLFGWTADIAAQLQDDSVLVLALVLTDMDIGKRSLSYGGVIQDIALNHDGSIKRINLDECERYMIDLAEDLGDTFDKREPLSLFDHFTIEAAHIRNVVFEYISIPSADADEVSNG